MNILSNDAPMNLLPVKCIISEETSISDLKVFNEGFRRIQKVKAELSHHEIPAGNLHAVVLTAVHGLSPLAVNFETFLKGNFSLTTSHAGDYIRYVQALETAVETVVDDINDPTVTEIISAQEIFEGTVVDFSPCDEYELEELGITPVMFLPEGAQEEV